MRLRRALPHREEGDVQIIRVLGQEHPRGVQEHLRQVQEGVRVTFDSIRIMHYDPD